MSESNPDHVSSGSRARSRAIILDTSDAGREEAASRDESLNEHQAIGHHVLESRRVRLRPVLPNDVPALHEIEASQFLGPRWRQGGRVVGFDPMPRGLNGSDFSQYLIVPATEPASGRGALGLAGLYGVDALQGFGYLMFAKFDRDVPALVFFEGLTLFVEFVFSRWPLRKLYGETMDYNFTTFASGAGRFFHVEGHMPEHEFYNGAFRDKLVLAVYRTEWQQFRDQIHRFLYGRDTPASSLDHDGLSRA